MAAEEGTRYCVVIPAFNCSTTLGPLLQAASAQGLDVIVVDDGSSDDTAAVAGQYRATVITHPGNLGKGTALRSGFSYALQQSYDGVITMDGDGQHDPRDVAILIQASERSGADLVLGNRMGCPASMPLSRRCVNRLMSWIVSRTVGREIPDSQCGLRLIQRRLLAQVSLTARCFEIETELVVKAGRGNWTILSVPVRTIYRGQKSHIRLVRDTARFLGVILQEMCSRALPKSSRLPQ